jgi:hypothetical protein
MSVASSLGYSARSLAMHGERGWGSSQELQMPACGRQFLEGSSGPMLAPHLQAGAHC